MFFHISPQKRAKRIALLSRMYVSFSKMKCILEKKHLFPNILQKDDKNDWTILKDGGTGKINGKSEIIQWQIW